MAETIEISKPLLEALLNYLGSKPYIEVHQLMHALIAFAENAKTKEAQ